MSKLRSLKIEGSEEELEEIQKKLDKQDIKTIKIFGDPIILEE